MLHVLLLLEMLSLVLGGSSIQGRDTAAGQYRRRGMQRVAVLGDYIYINGGEISNYEDGVKPDDEDDSSTVTSTQVFPHSESWDNKSVSINSIDDGPPSINSAAFWNDPDGNHLYRWGGSLSRKANIARKDVVLWEFRPDGGGSGSWSTPVPAGDTFSHIVGSTGGAYASCDRKGFWIGGTGRGATDPRLADVDNDATIPVPGILTYDMATSKWSNDSTAPMTMEGTSIMDSSAACAQGFQAESLIISIAGANPSVSNIYDTEKLSFVDMGNITFWDPKSKSWYWQEATGQVPPGRKDPCVASALSTNSTYEIFMYGGMDSNQVRDDMYILSLPGFQWFHVDVDSPERVYHSCATVGKRQMLSTGGITDEWEWKPADPWINALGIFDMTELKWKDSYDAYADEYESPKIVKDWYDNGGLSSVKWSNDDVKSKFVKENETDSDSSSNTGAIVGGVVGAVATLGLVGAVVWFILRRRRSNDKGKALELNHAQITPSSRASSPPFEVVGYGSRGTPSMCHNRSYFKTSPGTTALTSSPSAPVEMPTGDERHELFGKKL